MKPLTIFLGRLIGVLTLIEALWMLLDHQELVPTLPAILGDRPILLVLAFISLIAGLALVLAHNFWSGGLLTLLVTLSGWIFLIRGLLLMFVPYRETPAFLVITGLGAFFYVYLLVAFLFGIVMTYLAFAAPGGDLLHNSPSSSAVRSAV